MKKLIVIRSQKSVGRSSSKFGGPDSYIAVIEVPEGAIVPKVMRRSLLEARGIVIHYCGEGYSAHTTKKTSMWRVALQKAIDICDGMERYV